MDEIERYRKKIEEANAERERLRKLRAMKIELLENKVRMYPERFTAAHPIITYLAGAGASGASQGIRKGAALTAEGVKKGAELTVKGLAGALEGARIGAGVGAEAAKVGGEVLKKGGEVGGGLLKTGATGLWHGFKGFAKYAMEKKAQQYRQEGNLVAAREIEARLRQIRADEERARGNRVKA